LLNPAKKHQSSSPLNIIQGRGEKSTTSTSSPVNSNHQLVYDKELYLSLISLYTTRLSFQKNNLYIRTMAVFA